jgi:hypothetical protein
MNFEGATFRRSRTVVLLPIKDEAGALMPYVAEGREHFVCFGRVVKQGKPLPANAVKTLDVWDKDDSKPVYAVPIPLKKHSYANMAHGEDGKKYLAEDGACWVLRYLG